MSFNFAQGKSSGKQTETFQPTEELTRLNQIRLAQTEEAVGGSGGLAGFANPITGASLFAPGSQEQQVLGQLFNFGQAPGSFAPGAISPYEQEAIGTLRGGTNATPFSFDDSLSADREVAAANALLERIVGPQLVNRATVSGQGRSGAPLEALANAGTQLTLPVLENLERKRQFNVGTSQRAFEEAQGRGERGRVNLASLLQSLGPLLTGRAQGGLETSLGAAAAPREAGLADFLRRQDLLQTIFTGLPVTTAGTSAGRFSGKQSQFGGSVDIGQIIGAIALAGCWLAEAVFGVENIRTQQARLYLCTKAPRWFRRAYRRFAPGLAKTRYAKLFRPVVAYMARKGA